LRLRVMVTSTWWTRVAGKRAPAFRGKPVFTCTK